MRQSFSWFPDKGSSLDREPSVTVTKFGDGYEVRAPNGINNNPQKWSLRFSRTTAEGNAIEAFLAARNAVEAFDWINPNGEPGVYVCRKWNAARSEMGVVVVSGVFEQVFEA